MTRAALALLLLAIPLAPRAGGPERIELRVGERKAMGAGFAPVCDDPAVAIISADGGGTLVAKGEGRTLCSLQMAGGRRVFEVVVLPEKKGRDASGGGG